MKITKGCQAAPDDYGFIMFRELTNNLKNYLSYASDKLFFYLSFEKKKKGNVDNSYMQLSHHIWPDFKSADHEYFL